MYAQLLRLPALFFAAALLLVGCDSGVAPGTETTDGTPTVTFARSGVGAAPSDTVSIDVVLNNPDGNAVSVDVLFAEPASSATPDDVNGLTLEDVQTVSFPADAADGTTQSVDVILTADITDGQKTARFALQNLQTNGAATLGEQREFAINVGPESIASALAKGVGANVTIQGTVTRAFGSYARIQDDSGDLGASGITIRQTFGDLSGNFQSAISNGTIEPGTVLLVTGTISEFRGLTQINNTDLTAFTVVEQGTAPDPIEVSLADVADDSYLNLLVRIPDIELLNPPTTFSSSTTYTVTDGAGTEVPLRVQGGDESNVGGSPAPQGPFTFEGVMGTFSGAQLLPIQPTDIVGGDDGGGPSAVTIAEARNQGSGASVIVEGTVTRAFGDFVRLQDDSGPTGASAIVIRQTGGDFNSDVADGTITAGTTLRVTGTLSEFNGLVQINEGDLASYEVTGSAAVPAPQSVTLAELDTNGEDYESELVEITDLTFPSATGTFENSTNYTVEDPNGDQLTLRVQSDSESALGGTSIPAGAFTYEGVVGEFRESYQLIPVRTDDITVP